MWAKQRHGLIQLLRQQLSRLTTSSRKILLTTRHRRDPYLQYQDRNRPYHTTNGKLTSEPRQFLFISPLRRQKQGSITHQPINKGAATLHTKTLHLTSEATIVTSINIPLRINLLLKAFRRIRRQLRTSEPPTPMFRRRCLAKRGTIIRATKYAIRAYHRWPIRQKLSLNTITSCTQRRLQILRQRRPRVQRGRGVVWAWVEW